ncbi:hypothetical protein ACFWUP_09710 [Nocardia sp. NPDC058658]|uniref:hypothetical protein n=1 Tax=Nocardia sp. NPDC058658 TaxID=3346580 RepID=UPI00365B6BDB
MIRRVAAALIATAMLTSCQLLTDLDQDTSPGLPRAFGARMTDGILHIWTGPQCPKQDRLSFLFDRNNATYLVLASELPEGADIEYLTLGHNPGWRIITPLPQGFDWKTKNELTLMGESTDIPTVVRESTAHPNDTYWFQDIGWLNLAEVAALNGKKFLTLCSPDPRDPTPTLK